MVQFLNFINFILHTVYAKKNIIFLFKIHNTFLKLSIHLKAQRGLKETEDLEGESKIIYKFLQTFLTLPEEITAFLLLHHLLVLMLFFYYFYEKPHSVV